MPEAAYEVAARVAPAEMLIAILLAGNCGLRRGEIARARREDLQRDLVGWSLVVVGKGGHVRHVPVPDELADLMPAERTTDSRDSTPGAASGPADNALTDQAPSTPQLHSADQSAHSEHHT